MRGEENIVDLREILLREKKEKRNVGERKNSRALKILYFIGNDLIHRRLL